MYTTFTNDEALSVLENFIQSPYFPDELVENKSDYSTDEDKIDPSVMCYFYVTEHVYENYLEKYARSMETAFQNYLRNTDDIPRELTMNNFETTTVEHPGEYIIVIAINDEYMVFEGIGWDPSMSNDPSAPFNQEDFIDSYSNIFSEFEGRLDLTSEQVDEIYDENYSNFDDAMLKTYNKLYNDLYVKGTVYNPELGDELQEMTPAYHQIEAKVRANDVTSKKSFKRALNEELLRNLLNTYFDEFAQVYYSNIPQRQNENNVQQVQAGEVVKLQKPEENTFTDVETNNDGVEIGNCSICGADNVVVADHICKTVVDPKAYESLILKGFIPRNMITSINEFKTLLDNSNAIMETIKNAFKNVNESDKNEIDNSSEAEYQSNKLLSSASYKDDMINDIKEMFPDFKNDELDEATGWAVDYIYDVIGHRYEDYEWQYIEPVLKEKVKTMLLNV